MSAYQWTWGVVAPAVALAFIVAASFMGADPNATIGFLAAVPALAAVTAPVLWVAILALCSVGAAAVTSAVALGQDFRSALSALIAVIAFAAVSVMAAALRPRVATRIAPTQERAPLATLTHDEGDATDDSVTGLPTRASVLASIGGGVPRDCWVALLDIDDLAAINDEHGREVGDTLLFAVAGRTRYSLNELPRREQQVVARWGDDEFLVIVSPADGAGLDALRAIAAKVNDHPIRSDAGLVDATLCSGIVRWAAGTALVDAIAQARRALHAAKLAGRAQCVIRED